MGTQGFWRVATGEGAMSYKGQQRRNLDQYWSEQKKSLEDSARGMETGKGDT